jgi:hypothetical protein
MVAYMNAYTCVFICTPLLIYVPTDVYLYVHINIYLFSGRFIYVDDVCIFVNRPYRLIPNVCNVYIYVNTDCLYLYDYYCL